MLIILFARARTLDDWGYYFTNQKTPSEVFEIWSEEFKLRYKEKNVFCPTLHPIVTGRPSRIILLENLIRYFKKFPDVNFMRVKDYTMEAKKNNLWDKKILNPKKQSRAHDG